MEQKIFYTAEEVAEIRHIKEHQIRIILEIIDIFRG
jgi:hypothetical protein